MAFFLLSFQPTALWLTDALSQLPSHNKAGSINATQEQIEAFYKTITS